MADIDDNLTGQHLADLFHLQVLAEFVDHPVDGALGGSLRARSSTAMSNFDSSCSTR